MSNSHEGPATGSGTLREEGSLYERWRLREDLKNLVASLRGLAEDIPA
jgi:hypothetical protein